MKIYKIAFWVTTTAIFLFEGVLVALTMNSQLAIQGITALGYPVYFVFLLGTFKILGTIVLMVPQFPRRLREWAYAGFAIDFISATVSIWVVGGFGVSLILPVVCFIFLVISYVSYNKLHSTTI